MFINIDKEQNLSCLGSVSKKSEQLSTCIYYPNYDDMNKESRTDIWILI